MADAEKRRAKQAVHDMVDLYMYIMQKQNYTGYDIELMKKLRLVDAGPDGWVEWEFEITDFYSNLNGVMHGGAAGVILDMGTTTALCPLQKPGYWEFMGGVTRALNFSYLKAIPINTTIRIRSQVVQHGRTMALIRGSMESVDGKTVYVTCEHHKVNVPSLKEHVDLRAEMMRVRNQRGGIKL